MKLRRTERINNLINDYKKQADIEPTQIGEQWIDHRFVVKLGKVFSQPLADVLHGTEVYIDPRPAPIPKTKAYIELMARLKRDEEEREYKRLAGLTGTEKTNLQAVTKEVNEQLTTIFNVLVSVVAVAWAFWYWCSSWYLGARILAALFAGIVVAIAEVVVLNGYHRRLNEGKTRKALKEKHISNAVEEKHVEKKDPNSEPVLTAPTPAVAASTSVANSAQNTTKKRVTAH